MSNKDIKREIVASKQQMVQKLNSMEQEKDAQHQETLQKFGDIQQKVDNGFQQMEQKLLDIKDQTKPEEELPHEIVKKTIKNKVNGWIKNHFAQRSQLILGIGILLVIVPLTFFVTYGSLVFGSHDESKEEQVVIQNLENPNEQDYTKMLMGVLEENASLKEEKKKWKESDDYKTKEIESLKDDYQKLKESDEKEINSLKDEIQSLKNNKELNNDIQ